MIGSQAEQKLWVTWGHSYNLWFASEVGMRGSLVGLSPSPLGPGTWVGVRVELNYRTSSWYLREQLRCRKIPTHLVTRSVRNEVFCVGSKGETHRKSVFPLYMVVTDPYPREIIWMPPRHVRGGKAISLRGRSHGVQVSMFAIVCQGVIFFGLGSWEK